MLLIIQASSNTIYPSLSERITVTGTPYFLIRFINDLSKEETSVIATNTSGDFNTRYHQLSFTEASGATTVQRQTGTVTLSPPGGWTYEIYEQTSATNLDYSSATSRLEVGKVKVMSLTEAAQWEYTGGSSATIIYSG